MLAQAPKASADSTTAILRLAQPAPLAEDCANVAEDRQQVLIFLDGKCFESTLPDVTAGSITSQVATHLCGHQPVHPAAHLAVLARPEARWK